MPRARPARPSSLRGRARSDSPRRRRRRHTGRTGDGTDRHRARRLPGRRARRRGARQRAARQPAVPASCNRATTLVGGTGRDRGRRPGRDARARVRAARDRSRPRRRRPPDGTACRCRPRSSTGRRVRHGVERGRLVVIDYLATSDELAERGETGWLRTYREHERGGRPSPHLVSRTSPSTCRRSTSCHAAARAGFHLEHDVTQAEWLRELGIDDLVDHARREWDAARTSVTSKPSVIAAESARAPPSSTRRSRCPSGAGVHPLSRAGTGSARPLPPEGTAYRWRGDLDGGEVGHDRVAARRRPHLPAARRLHRAGVVLDARRLRRGRRRPRGVLGRSRRSSSTGSSRGTPSSSGSSPFAKWFVGGKLNAALQLPRPPRRRGPRRQGRLLLGGRARRHPHHHLRRPPARRLAARQRA